MGMLIEGWLAIGHIDIRIISSRRGSAIAEKMREEGYAVTEIPMEHECLKKFQPNTRF